MISKRLKESAKYVKGFHCLADCGTDHGYLPIYVMKHGFVQKAIASDNKEFPLQNARRNIFDEQVKVETILADGLPYLDDEIDVVSILGMGGRLIVEILANADLKDVKRLVLSPNSDQIVLRRFLQEHGFAIVEEIIIKDKSKYYQIIVSEPGAMTLSDIEFEFGPIIIENKTQVFVDYISKLIHKLEAALQKTSTIQSRKILENRIQLLKEVIS